MSYYQRHVFFCVNQRAQGEPCCNNFAAQSIRDYVKSRLKKLALSGAGKVRVNQSGCLGRCNEGPVLVIYPEAVWYTYDNQRDIDEIIARHLLHGEVVERLKI